MYMNFEDDSDSRWRCSQCHRSSLNLLTDQGGTICVVCFLQSHLKSSLRSPTIHVWVLLNCEKEDELHVYIKDIYGPISVLVTCLQLP
ncbi:hypothetical protein L195_g050940, partial [Trifolium pratense]